MFTGRIYNNYDKRNFVNNLLVSDWTKFNQTTSPDVLWNCIYGNIQAALSIKCPIKSCTVPESKPKWLTHDVIMLMRDTDTAYRRARRTNQCDDWNIARFLRNWVEIAIKDYKSRYLKELFETNKNNAKKFWSGIREVLPREPPPPIVTLINHATNHPLPTLQLPDYINRYFTTIGATLAAELPIPNYPPQPVTPNGFDLHIPPVTIAELNSFIGSINTTKSSAIHDINSTVMKHAFQAIPDKMMQLNNMCLPQSIFPQAWKSSMIIPFPKKGNPRDLSNLRPISLLPLTGKILKRIVCKRLTSIDFICEYQHGFRPKHSTTTAVTKLIHDIFNNLKTRNNTHAVFLDLKRAFDTVCHAVLLNKLAIAGLGRRSIDWFADYLANRTQKVNLDGHISKEQPITYGVPQGSVLGPILLSIYINDIVSTVLNSHVLMYADDTVLYNSDMRLLVRFVECRQLVQQCIDHQHCKE